MSGLEIGQRVVALPPCGAFAEYVTLDQRRVSALPDRVALEQSLAYPVNLKTAYLMALPAQPRESLPERPAGRARRLPLSRRHPDLMATMPLRHRPKSTTPKAYADRHMGRLARGHAAAMIALFGEPAGS